MESIVNYSSEDEREDSPKRNVAERCLAIEIDPVKRNKGDSSRRPREENLRGSSSNERSQITSHRDKEAPHGSFRKSNHNKEENSRGSSRFTGCRDYYNRGDRRAARTYDKKRDVKDERRRRDGHRDRDYESRDIDRDRRDRSDRYRRERYDRDNSYHDKDRRRKSQESSPPSSKDRNTGLNHRNRNRSRSRSPSKEQYTANTSSYLPQETVLMDAKQQKSEQKEEVTPLPSVTQSKVHPSNTQAVITPPLNDAAPSMPNVSNKTGSTPIALPTYYNPNIINPTKYAEQVQKRKLIWGAKKTEDTAAKWGHATFSEDSDGKVASKFMRLMGIKSVPKTAGSTAEPAGSEKTGPDVKSRQAMFSNMEQQYEVARQVTHTMRGVGLGFGSQSRQY